MLKRVGIIIASLAVSAVFLWFAVRDVPVDLVFGTIWEAQPVWTFAALVVLIAGIYTRSIRWRGLVNYQISSSRAFYIIGIMHLLNLLPFRLGELARTGLAAREGIPLVTAATSIVVERLLDMVFVLTLLAFMITRIAALPAEVINTAWLFGVLAVIAFAVLIGLARYPDFSRGVLAAIEKRIPILQRLPLEQLLENALDGLKPLVDWRSFAHGMGWTLVSWLFSYLSFYLSQMALGLTPADWEPAAFGMTLASFSVALPASIAAIGPFQAAVRVAGETFGVDDIISTAHGFMIHGLAILSYAITGIWGFLGLGVALADVLQTDTAAPAVEPEGTGIV